MLSWVQSSVQLGRVPSVRDNISMSVVTGLERLLDEELDRISGKHIGLIANPATVDTTLRHAVDLFHERTEICLEVLFGPEHGLRATAQDLIEIGDTTDCRTGLPIRSLYGPVRMPSKDMLAGLDAIVYDIQDVGSRYYTYIWTMAYAMEACARYGLEFIILDRPNPIGGELIEGNLIDRSFTSFVGLYPIPNRHGMTSGEIACLVNNEFDIGCRLSIVSMKRWKRSQWFDETGLPWVMPSPNMPTLNTAMVYPGACLIEGTNVSEGRGTTRPFEIVGAPWVDSEKLVAELQNHELPGVRFRSLAFEPTFHKYAGTTCIGVQQHVTERRRYKPLRVGYALLIAIRKLWPDSFAWREPPYEYELERPAIDILAGNSEVRRAIEQGAEVQRLEQSWEADLERFRNIRERYLLYE